MDRGAPELPEHLAGCPECRARAEEIQAQIGLLTTSLSFAPLPLPERIGSYSIKRLIGEGGQALVYEAEQENPRRRIALKVLRGGPLADKGQVSRFEREIRTLARLHDPSIATIYEAGRTADGQCFIAMELVEGLPLDQYVDEVAPAFADRIQLCRRICAAVQYAHEHEVIHRDLKPSNILVQPNGVPRILDFGLARLTQSDPSQIATRTQPGTIQGTPRYMSPEQIRGQPDAIDHRCDVYALGVLFFEVLVGASPFALAPGTLEGVQVLRREEPKRAGTINPRLRGDLEAILGKALEFDPNRRYPSVRALDDDLRRHLEGKAISARHVSAFRRWGRRLWKRRVPVGAGIATTLLLGSVSIWYFIRAQHDGQVAETQLRESWARVLTAPGDSVSLQKAKDVCDRLKNRQEAVLLRAKTDYLQRPPRYGIEALRGELDKHPEQWPCRLLLTELYDRNGQIREAEEQRRGLPIVRDAADNWFSKSLATLDADSALCRLQQALRCDSLHIRSLEYKATLLDMRGNWRGALDCVTRIVSRRRWLGYRVSSQYHHRLEYWLSCQGRLQTLIGELSEARQSYDQLIKIKKDDVFDGPWKQAQIWRRRADVGAFLDLLDAYRKRAQVWRRLGGYQHALDDLTEAIELAEREHKGNSVPWQHFDRGTVNWILGHPDAAVADYRRSSEILFGRPTFGAIRRAIILKELGRSLEADTILSELRAPSSRDPNDRGGKWLGLIATCISGQMTPEDLVSAVCPDDRKGLCEAYYYAGEACRASGQNDRAKTYFKKCFETGVEVDSNFPLDPMSEYELAQWRLNPREAPVIKEGQNLLDPQLAR